MRKPRPNFKPSAEHRAAIGLASSKQMRTYGQSFSDLISERNGTTVYVYNTEGKLVTTYSSIIRLKKAYGITMHHKTLYKRIAEGFLFNNHTFKLSPLQRGEESITENGQSN
jgi:hypothetical protein